MGPGLAIIHSPSAVVSPILVVEKAIEDSITSGEHKGDALEKLKCQLISFPV